MANAFTFSFSLGPTLGADRQCLWVFSFHCCGWFIDEPSLCRSAICRYLVTLVAFVLLQCGRLAAIHTPSGGCHGVVAVVSMIAVTASRSSPSAIS